MPRLFYGRLCKLGLLAAALAGCVEPHAYLRHGDADSAEVTYSGDAAAALPVARKHCASFEKVPKLVDTGIDTVLFDCVKP